MPREKRRKAQGITPTLTAEVAAIVKGMLARGDRQSDISAYFSINQGRIWEIGSGARFRSVPAACQDDLPPPGPYVVVTKVSYEQAKAAEAILVRYLGLLEGATSQLRAELMQTLSPGGK